MHSERHQSASVGRCGARRRQPPVAIAASLNDEGSAAPDVADLEDLVGGRAERQRILYDLPTLPLPTPRVRAPRPGVAPWR
jgi:hypothetical protein